MAINWFPGHMAKTRRLISDNIKKVDIVLELVDARVPYSSTNPILPELLGNKKRLLILNKSDMADENANQKWVEHFKEMGITTICVDVIGGKNMNKIAPTLKEMLKEKIDRDSAKGMTKSVKIMVVGVPNVGKSSIINKLAGKKSLKVEDRPGVTKDKQWLSLAGDIDLLDTPGILWPKFEDEDVGYKLAITGAIRDEILEIEDIASKFLEIIKEKYGDLLIERYKINFTYDELQMCEGFQILEVIGRKRGFLLSGAEVDTLRTAKMVLGEFRDVKIGRISLEFPN